MQCWNIRELIKGNMKKSNLSGGIIDYYLEVKDLIENLDTTEFDYFIAGYMLGSNPNLKQEFLKFRRMNEKIRNNS